MSAQYSPSRLNHQDTGNSLEKNDLSEAGNVTTTASMIPPDFVQRWSPEERDRFEAALRRKIDFRLLPAVIVMYIMNVSNPYLVIMLSL